MSRIPILLFALLINIALTFGQNNFIVSGQLLDDETGQPVGHAALQLKSQGLGSISDEQGYFSFSVPESYLTDTVLVSVLGYGTSSVPLSIFQDGNPEIIRLKPMIYQIGEVEVSNLSALELIIKAIRKIDLNYQQDIHFTNSFYRQIHKEDGRYVRLIEADVDVLHAPYPSSGHTGLKDKVRVNRIRRSEVYEMNGDIHGDHLIDLLLENVIKYNGKTFLNESNLDYFNFWYDTTYKATSSNSIVIGFHGKEYSKSEISNGFIFIDPADDAITHIKINKFANPTWKAEHRSRWQFLNSNIDLQFEKRNRDYSLKSISWIYNHEVYDSYLNSVKYVVEESFQLFTDSLLADVEVDRAFKRFSNLYSRKYRYDEAFWERHIRLHPLPAEVVSDLERSISLREQFLRNSK